LNKPELAKEVNVFYGMTIFTRSGYFYMNFSHNLKDLIKDLKSYVKENEIDDKIPKVKEIEEKIKSSFFDQFIKEFSDGSIVSIMPVKKRLKAVITVHKGMVTDVEANVPLLYYVKDLDDTDPEEWKIEHQAKVVKL